jgi:hypothetical protein
MSSRATLALLLVAAALGAWVYFYEIQGKAQREEEEKAAKKLFVVEADAITALELPLDGGGEARLVRDPADATRWRIESPIAYAADGGVVSGLLSGLVGLESEAKLAKPADLAPFGLDDKRRELRAFTGEAEPRRLWLGGAAPIGATRYVAVPGDEHVFTVKDGAARALEPRLETLRDRRVTALDPASVTAFRVNEKGAAVVAAKRAPAPAPEPAKAEGEKAGDEPAEAVEPPAEPAWELVEPLAEKADGGAVRRAIENLAYARAITFVDAPEAPAKYGLDPPAFEVVLESGGAEHRYELGRVNEMAYVRADGKPPLFQVPPRLLDDVPRDLFAYRFKQVLKLDEQAVKKLDVEFPRDGKTYRFALAENAWKAEGADVEVEATRIEDILYAIRDLEAKAPIEASVALADLGLEKPRVRITARDADDKELGRLELGDDDPATGTAARTSQNDRLWRVATDLASDIPLGEEAFRNRWVKQSAAEEPALAPQPEAAVEGHEP